MSPGTPVLGAADPAVITRPRLWPRWVSTTAWQSTPAVNPGPRATTTGASVMAVPVLRLARMASTRPSKAISRAMSPAGSASTGISPAESRAGMSPAAARRAVMPSTAAVPSYMHWQKDTVRRTAAPVARSPAPLIKTSIVRHAPFPCKM